MARESPPPPSDISLRVNSRRNNNVVHPVEITLDPPSVTATPFHYREVKQHYKKWFPWLVPSFVVANIIVFIITMYVNNCPNNSVSCIATFLGRFSFQPFKENPLLGPSSLTWVFFSLVNVIFLVSAYFRGNNRLYFLKVVRNCLYTK